MNELSSFSKSRIDSDLTQNLSYAQVDANEMESVIINEEENENEDDDQLINELVQKVEVKLADHYQNKTQQKKSSSSEEELKIVKSKKISHSESDRKLINKDQLDVQFPKVDDTIKKLKINSSNQNSNVDEKPKESNTTSRSSEELSNLEALKKRSLYES